VPAARRRLPGRTPCGWWATSSSTRPRSPRSARNFDVRALLRQLGVAGRRACCWWPAARTTARRLFWRTCARRLREKFPKLFLILVPRHFRTLQGGRPEAAGARRQICIYRNEIFPGTQTAGRARLDCLLVNTTGELKFFYEPATVVFVGKSLTAVGGQNPGRAGRRRAKPSCSARTCRTSPTSRGLLSEARTPPCR
jgi:hypothetical protein